MRRCWFGFALLVVLLAGSILVTAHMEDTHAPMAEAAKNAARHSLSGDWAGAMERLQEARSGWERGWRVSAAFADHEPMETINGLFAQLEVAAALRDTPTFATLCARLCAELEAMGDAHGFTWWNLL